MQRLDATDAPRVALVDDEQVLLRLVALQNAASVAGLMLTTEALYTGDADYGGDPRIEGAVIGEDAAAT